MPEGEAFLSINVPLRHQSSSLKASIHLVGSSLRIISVIRRLKPCASSLFEEEFKLAATGVCTQEEPRVIIPGPCDVRVPGVRGHAEANAVVAGLKLVQPATEIAVVDIGTHSWNQDRHVRVAARKRVHLDVSTVV